MKRLLPIVEGDGDMQAVPPLMRRVLNDVLFRSDVTVLRAQKRGEWPRVKRDFERVYRSARLEAAPILWVVDFDGEDCRDSSVERKWLGEQARRIDSSGRVEVVFMIQEYESLFLSEPRALRQTFPELRSDLAFPPNPEAIRNAKGWISTALPKGRAYKPTIDQARITARLDLDALRSTSESYRRFERAVQTLVQ
jgi:Domain of unknown function (DUF4276)